MGAAPSKRNNNIGNGWNGNGWNGNGNNTNSNYENNSNYGNNSNLATWGNGDTGNKNVKANIKKNNVKK